MVTPTTSKSRSEIPVESGVDCLNDVPLAGRTNRRSPQEELPGGQWNHRQRSFFALLQWASPEMRLSKNNKEKKKNRYSDRFD